MIIVYRCEFISQRYQSCFDVIRTTTKTVHLVEVVVNDQCSIVLYFVTASMTEMCVYYSEFSESLANRINAVTFLLVDSLKKLSEIAVGTP
jgi:hypothetical protein